MCIVAESIIICSFLIGLLPECEHSPSLAKRKNTKLILVNLICSKYALKFKFAQFSSRQHLKGGFQFIVLPVCDQNLLKLGKRCTHAHAIFKSYCTHILVAEEKSLTLFRPRSGPKLGSWSFKIDKTWHNFLISYHFFSVYYSMSCRKTKIIYMIFKDLLTNHEP